MLFMGPAHPGRTAPPNRSTAACATNRSAACELFFTLKEAEILSERLRCRYHHLRSHSSPAGRWPASKTIVWRILSLGDRPRPHSHPRAITATGPVNRGRSARSQWRTVDSRQSTLVASRQGPLPPPSGRLIMKVLIVGAGAQGHVITWNLARCPAVSEIVLGDIDETRARAVADQVGGVQTKAIALDAGDVEALKAAAAGAKLVMNATIPEFNMKVIEACLAVGVDYQDMATGTLIDKTIDRRPSCRWSSTRISARPASRCSPAPAWIPASPTPSRHRLRRPRQVLRDPHQGLRPVRIPVPLQMWSLETYYTDCAQPPLTFENGEYKRVAPSACGGLRLSGAVRAWRGGRARPRRGLHVAALAAQEVRRQGPEQRRLQAGHRGGGHQRRPAFVASGMASKEPAWLRDVSLRPIDVYSRRCLPTPLPRR